MTFVHFGTGTGIRNTVPNIGEQEREWERAANFPKYWENNREILNSSKTLHILRAMVAEKSAFHSCAPIVCIF